MPSEDTSMVPSLTPAMRELLARVRQMVPPLRSRFHKGQLGRVGVLGGCDDYTGAPYFSAMASARLGCDLSHVICTPAAAAVIKTYSPNLMVHPLLREGGGDGQEGADSADRADINAQADAVSRRIAEKLLPRLHVLVVGPGLGRDPLLQATAARVLAAARARALPVVVDADALLIVPRQPALLRGYPLAVLTPNVVEFRRLEEAAEKAGGEKAGGGGGGGGGDKAGSADASARAAQLARTLGVTLVQKGAVDIVAGADGAYGPYVCDVPGGRKRSGGQGDTLTGSIATFLAWRAAYLDGLWPPRGDGPPLDARELVLLAAVGGSAITRECSRLAFAKRGRSMQASDLTDEVHTAFTALFGEDADDDEGDEAKL